MDRHFQTIGIDRQGQVYALALDGDRSGCAVVRPVEYEVLRYFLENPDSVKEAWKQDVAVDATEYGLLEYFEKYIDRFIPADAGDYPGKDKTFVPEVLEDKVNPTVVRVESDTGMTFRKFAETMIRATPEIEVQGKDKIVTWEAAGWFHPMERLVVELAPAEILEPYYAELEETAWKIPEEAEEPGDSNDLGPEIPEI